MKVLVACEESQAVANAFRRHGHEAYSCDIKPCSGGHPEWHIQGDAIHAMEAGKWDLLIAHPPCTYLSNVSAPLLHTKGGFDIDDERYEKLLEARRFFMTFFRSGIERVCIENPTPLKASALPKPSQAIQPTMFGHPYTKRTCLWLKGLPPLMATEIEPKSESWIKVHRDPTVRSKTFPGIAEAMAVQWGSIIERGA